MRAFVALLILFLIAGCSSSAHITQMASDNVRYIIEPITFENKPALQFSLTFMGQASGKTFLELPSRWASEKDYFKDIKKLTVVTPGVTMTEGEKPYIKVLNHPPSRIIEMTYILTEQPPQGPQPFRSQIQKDYFHFVGYAALVSPNSPDNINSTYEIIFKNFPSQYELANSFSGGGGALRIRTSLGTLKRAVYLGGDYRMKSLQVGGRDLTLAIRGAWQFSDDDFFKTAAQVVEYQRGFWNDMDFPYFFIALSPDRAEKGSAGGTGLTNSFFMSVTKEFTLQNKIIPLLSHEFFHTWNGGKIRQAEPESRYYWFSEGFTTYYSRLLNLRAGLISLPQYVSDVNEAIFAYSTSPVRTAANSRIEKEFWKNDNIGKLPYYRGDFLAMNWDTKIKLSSQNKNSLDRFMKALLEDARKSNVNVNDEVVSRLIEKDIPSVRADLRAFIAQGNIITPEEKALGPCVKREFISMGKFEHGFDREKTYATGVITGLKNGSPAHKAGLREGMKLIDREMVHPPFTASKMKIMDHGVEKWISFIPVGQKKYLMPHYVLDEKKWKKDPAACLAWFQPTAG